MSVWHLVERPGFRIRFPSGPHEQLDADGSGSLDLSEPPRSFVLTWTPADARWIALQASAVTGGREVLADETHDGVRHIVIVRDTAIQFVRIVLHGGTGYIVSATSPDRDDETVASFLRSFAPR